MHMGVRAYTFMYWGEGIHIYIYIYIHVEQWESTTPARETMMRRLNTAADAAATEASEPHFAALKFLRLWRSGMQK